MANKHKFTLAVNTVGCQEDVVTVSSDTLAEAALMAALIFVAACQLRLVRGFDDEDRKELEGMIETVKNIKAGQQDHWRVSDTQVIFVHREEF